MNKLCKTRKFLMGTVAALAACTIAPAVNVANARGGPSKIVIGIDNPIASIPGQQAFIYGAKQAAQHYGFTVKVLDANLSNDREVTDIDTFVSEHVSGITTWTLDAGAAGAAYQRAHSAGIPIVAFNSTSPYFNSVIKTDTDSSCVPIENAVNYIASRVPKAKVFVIGGPAVPSITFTVHCFLAAAKKAKLDVVAKQDNVNDTSSGGQQLTRTILTRYPDLQAIWSFDDVGGIGASAALRAAGKTIWSGTQKGIILIGKDGDPAAIAGIKAKAYTATFDENPTLAGAASVAAIAAILHGTQVPKAIRVPYVRYDASNADSYVDPLKRTITFKGHCMSDPTHRTVCVPGA
jgi:ribose transport system substrate-binding protein